VIDDPAGLPDFTRAHAEAADNQLPIYRSEERRGGRPTGGRVGRTQKPGWIESVVSSIHPGLCVRPTKPAPPASSTAVRSHLAVRSDSRVRDARVV